MEQQRIESSDTDEALLIKGTGWVTLGIKLGAVESAIGFVPPQFGVVLARRILRFLGRALLIIGLLKGCVFNALPNLICDVVAYKLIGSMYPKTFNKSAKKLSLENANGHSAVPVSDL